MSGRKSSEVANVLASGEKVRQYSDNVIWRQIERDKSNIDDIAGKIENIKKSLGQEIELSGEVTEIFGSKAEAIHEKYKELRRNILSKNIQLEMVNSLVKELTSINEKERKTDVQADNIRRAIANKRDYCTPEYNQAKKLVQTYKQCRDGKQRIQDQMMGFADDASEMLHGVTASSRQVTSLKKQIIEMKDIAQKRLASDEQREQLGSLLADIDKKIAIKFLAKEYDKLQKQVETMIASSDDVVLQGFSQLYGNITAFCSELNEKYEKWQKEKEDAESFLQSIRELEEVSYYDPLDNYNNGENGKKESLYAYLKKYAGNDEYAAKASKLLAEAEKLIAKESFIDSMNSLREAKTIVLEARDKALKLQENMLQKTELAGLIMDAMVKMRYDTDLEILDGNPNNGYRVISRVGDEIIDFDKIDIDDNGEIILHVNHQESLSGTCGNSWQQIVPKMRAFGVPITDVKKNGVSLLSEPSSGTKIKSKEIKRTSSVN